MVAFLPVPFFLSCTGVFKTRQRVVLDIWHCFMIFLKGTPAFHNSTATSLSCLENCLPGFGSSESMLLSKSEICTKRKSAVQRKLSRKPTERVKTGFSYNRCPKTPLFQKKLIAGPHL
jgi:hypothetical protein